MKKIFLAGKVGIGKSTIIKNILEVLSINHAGFVTLPVIETNTLKGFKIKDISSGEEQPIGFFDKNFMIHPVVEGFEELGTKSLENALKGEYVLVIMDELGFLENSAPRFKEMVLKILKCDKPVLGAIKIERNVFLNEVSKMAKIIEVTEKNRNELPEKIRRIINGWTL